MPPKRIPSSNLKAQSHFKICVFAIVFFVFTTKSISQASSIRTGVSFNWADTQSSLNDPATLQSININGTDYTTFVVPTSYEMTRLGPGGDSQNNIWINGTQATSGSDDPDWVSDALDAYQSLNLNHYFQSNSAGDNFCNDYSAVATTNAQIQTIRYLPGIPSNPDGVIAITERGGNNCMYIELYGIPAGGGPEQLLGTTFVRNQGNLTGVRPQAPPSTNSDYWSSGRNNENNQIIGIALYHLSDLAPVGSTITSIRYFGATTDHGDGKFFLMQTYAEDDSLEIKLDREGNGDIAENDLVPSGSTYNLISGPTHGALTFNADGTFNYIPNPGFTGNDTFQYEVCLPAPNTAVCDTGTAVIVIRLEAIFDMINVAQNATNRAINVLDNDNFGSAGPRLAGAITNFTSPGNGSMALNDNGSPSDPFDDFFAYTPDTDFIGTDFFTYEITDAVGSTDTASVYITVAFDSDVDTIDDKTDLDDDNDGILDANEGIECIDDDYFAWEFNAPTGTRTNDFVQNPAITNWLITTTTDVSTGIGLSGNSPGSELQLTDMEAATYAEAVVQNEYVEVGFTTAAGLINPIIERIGVNWYQNSGGAVVGNSYDVAIEISKDNFATSIGLYSDIRIHYPSNGVSEFFNLLPSGSSFNLEENTSYTIRVYTYNQQSDGNVAYSVFDDFTIRVSSCQEQHSDSDGIPDHLDNDSDGDTCLDVTEAGHNDADSDGYLGTSPVTVDMSGLITGQGGYTGTRPRVVTPDQSITIDQQPIDQIDDVGGTAVFSALVSGTGLIYQWEVSTDEGGNWTALSDNATHSGTATNTLTIANISSVQHTNDYRLFVSSTNSLCNGIVSISANLDVAIDLDSDDDGILDALEDLNEDADNNPATNPTDSDNDSYPDYLDIDSDNDGIPDNVEAQTTLGYIAPSLIDINTNGLDDAYESGTDIGIDPVNTDGVDAPDYLDTDSDNDGVSDAVEGNDHDQDGEADVFFIGSDKDNDGLDDSFEGVEQLDVDVNDEIDDPINDLPNTDGDDQSDYRDVDDDGDGIPTEEEDTNNDMDYTNDDWDNDGIPDYLDPDPEVEVDEVEIFNVVTPNGDGVHDILTITGLERRPDNNLQIYNRWGVLVFSTHSYNTSGNAFSGISQGRTTLSTEENLPIGTYFYLFDYVDIDGETVNLSGHLYLN